MRSVHRPSSWFIVGAVLAFYAWAATTLLEDERRGAGALTWWIALVAPPMVYGGLIFLCVRGLSAARRIVATGVLCAVYASLGLLTAALYWVAGPLPFDVALTRALWGLPAAPLLQLLSVPLAVFPFRDLLGPRLRHHRVRFHAPRGEGLTPARRKPAPARPATGSAERRRALELEPRGAPSGLGAIHEACITGATPLGTTRPVRPGHCAVPAASAEARPSPSPVEAVVPAPPSPAPPEAERGDVTVAASVEALARAPLAEVEVSAPVVAERDPSSLMVTEPALEPPALEPAVEPVAAVLPTAPALVEAPSPVEAARVADQVVATEKIGAAFARFGTVKVEAEVLMGLTLVIVAPARLATDALLSAAFRFLPLLDGSLGREPVSQATLRGSSGAMVLTPFGPVAAGGPVLVVALRERGSLALFELLSLQVAAEFRATHAAPVAGAPTAERRAASDLAGAAVAPNADLLARSLGAWGEVTPSALRDPAGHLLVYLFLAPGMDSGLVGQFACDLNRATEMDGEPGGVGPVRSIMLRLGRQRLLVKPVGGGSGRSALLVAAGAEVRQPGLACLQLERAAARLEAA